jgi:hypothetical protein
MHTVCPSKGVLPPESEKENKKKFEPSAQSGTVGHFAITLLSKRLFHFTRKLEQQSLLLRLIGSSNKSSFANRPLPALNDGYNETRALVAQQSSTAALHSRSRASSTHCN